MHDRAGLLPEWAVAELRRPVMTSDALRDRVMTRVRAAHASHAAPAPLTLADSARRVAGAGHTPAARPGASRRHGIRASRAALALAASIVGIIATSTLIRSRSAPAGVLASANAGRMIVLGDTVDSALHDTLRLVRFVLDAPAAARVALAGDFNDWSRTATPLSDSAGSGVWSVEVALERRSGRYAFVVDDTQWVGTEPIEERAPGAAPLRAAPVGGDST